MMKRVRVKIFGKVQGVFFRAYTKEEAQKLGIKGWVKNLPDGSVEALFEGEEKAVDEMIKWCHKGSPSSIVTKVVVEEEPYVGEFKDFTIRY
ncbi:MAG: acylphosphatase [Caldimicrobium sp.]|nr:acylphosphatase [Caldimicrobium sp.]MCX7874358.1 acylphosphatase [Caldimicrobium sp.]MDW8093484.1 acylphosphatase [Caldimicrobium sp.]